MNDSAQLLESWLANADIIYGHSNPHCLTPGSLPIHIQATDPANGVADPALHCGILTNALQVTIERIFGIIEYNG